MERLTPLLAILAVLSVGDARAQLNIQSELSHDLAVIPGQSLDRTIVVQNQGAVPMTVRIYQTDYSFAADGSNAFDAPGTLERSNAGWITFEPSLAVVEPGIDLLVVFHVTIPPDRPDSELGGSYWSMLMIEGVPGNQLNPAEGQVGVQQLTRYGIQIATHVGPGSPSIEFTNGALEQTKDGPILKIDLINSGTVMLRPGVSLRMVNAQGEEIGPFESMPKRIYPGTSVRQIIRLKEVPAGEYSAILIADGGGEAVFGAALDLTL